MTPDIWDELFRLIWLLVGSPSNCTLVVLPVAFSKALVAVKEPPE